MMTIPFLMVSGFFVPEDNYAPYLIPFKYVSLFKWTYQILILNEFTNGTPLTCSNPPKACDVLKDLDFNETMATAYAVASSVAVAFGIVSFLILVYYVKIKL